ncbi:MAG: glycerol-3-phosphate dehydrogenase/oxidase, partial [Candidatus Hodarchaeota archaeon]
MKTDHSPLFSHYTANDRKNQVKRLIQTEWDLLVIGGGITGAGIAREAALRGLTVALLDQSDFASGTSSGSSKLAHGGIRYLKQREFNLVREATTERNWLRDKALPHLVRPLQFVYPIFREGEAKGHQLPQSPDSFRKIRLAVFLYDFLCGFHNYASREVIKDPDRLKELEPAFDVTGVIGAVLYYDTNLDDARLTIETIWEGIRTGKVCALNYMPIFGLIWDDNEKISGAIAVDRAELTGKEEQIQIKAKAVVNATGVWADCILGIDEKPETEIVRPTKGVHLAVRRSDLPVNRAFGIRSLDDGRFFFVLPRNDWVLIGTTDTDFNGNPSECYCNAEDADYLRRTVKVLFPEAKIEDKDLLGTYASLRPLVFEPGKAESDISRKHLILERFDSLLTIVGGKLTTFRKMSEDLLLDHIKPRIKKGYPKFVSRKGVSKIAYWVGMNREDWDNSEEVKSSNMSQVILNHLYEQYGKGGLKILQKTQDDPQMASRLIDDCSEDICPWILGEIDYVVKRECPVHLEDVLSRRMEVAWLVQPVYQGKAAQRATEVMAKTLRWSEERMQAEIRQYLDYIK